MPPRSAHPRAAVLKYDLPCSEQAPGAGSVPTQQTFRPSSPSLLNISISRKEHNPGAIVSDRRHLRARTEQAHTYYVGRREDRHTERVSHALSCWRHAGARIDGPTVA